MVTNSKYEHLRRFAFFLAMLTFTACAHYSTPEPEPPTPPPSLKPEIARVRFTIQVGAFSEVSNAIRLTHRLEKLRLSAYYYRHSSGLFKVRFGDFSTREEALEYAKTLVASGVIREYYIVSPDEYAIDRMKSYNATALRTDLVETAENYIGIPYQWGGTSPNEGFDCSGLVMAVYQLNGFSLPRCSYDQFAQGIQVDRSNLQKGDLVFFTDPRKDRVNHVGMYTGDNTFIHAPSKGKTIRKDSLSDNYFASRYAGARTYLR